MTSALQQAGSEFETRLEAEFLRHGFTDARRIRVKHPDRGDIGGVPGWTVEAKGIAYRKGGSCPECNRSLDRFDMNLSVDQAMRARMTTGDEYALVVRQRKNHPLSRAYAILELGLMLPIMRRLEES